MLQKQFQLSNRQTKIIYRNFLSASEKNPRTSRSSLWKRVSGQIRNCFHPGASSLVPMAFSLGKQISTAELVKTMLRSVWPKGNWKIRRLYIYSMMLLIVAKILNVYVPFLLKNVINYYNERVPTDLQLNADSYTSMFGIAAFSIIVTCMFYMKHS
ncbi:unnamed protein product [Onchocerca flexuosa]|uniref:Bestrophin homolog n=1 Tax=Onchocerca flexuosa TaxID=387005 RepID=A0A183HSK9_9BILA|nr:unnamed protein product [Onchocerca flexuosa]